MQPEIQAQLIDTLHPILVGMGVILAIPAGYVLGLIIAAVLIKYNERNDT